MIVKRPHVTPSMQNFYTRYPLLKVSPPTHTERLEGERKKESKVKKRPQRVIEKKGGLRNDMAKESEMMKKQDKERDEGQRRRSESPKTPPFPLTISSLFTKSYSQATNPHYSPTRYKPSRTPRARYAVCSDY